MPFALGEHRGRARVGAKIRWIRCTFYRAGKLELERIRAVCLAVRHHRVEGAIVAGGVGI